MSWIQCPRCGMAREREVEECGCVVTYCGNCYLIENDSIGCTFVLDEWEEEMDSKDIPMVSQ
jgi:late competence protein required for DNA uptake (superfamily II DNA/RNA helicase)